MDWKYFVIEVTYRVPVEQLPVADHRAFLQTGYDQGWLLVSGPMVPRSGGMLVGRAPSRAAIEEFTSRDPYRVNQLAEYRIVEFDPVKFAPLIEGWVKGE